MPPEVPVTPMENDLIPIDYFICLVKVFLYFKVFAFHLHFFSFWYFSLVCLNKPNRSCCHAKFLKTERWQILRELRKTAFLFKQKNNVNKGSIPNIPKILKAFINSAQEITYQLFIFWRQNLAVFIWTNISSSLFFLSQPFPVLFFQWFHDLLSISNPVTRRNSAKI